MFGFVVFDKAEKSIIYLNNTRKFEIIDLGMMLDKYLNKRQKYRQFSFMLIHNRSAVKKKCIVFQGSAKIKDFEALKENDVLLEWLIKELFKTGKHPHPHSRQVNSIVIHY